jgi:hypothetical protein
MQLRRQCTCGARAVHMHMHTLSASPLLPRRTVENSVLTAPGEIHETRTGVPTWLGLGLGLGLRSGHTHTSKTVCSVA